MYALAMCIAATAVGVEVGWQRMPEGGMEYIIHLDPQTLELLRAGETFRSDIMPDAGEVHSYRIVLGTKRPPRETPPAKPKSDDPTQSRSAAPQTLPPDPRGKPFPERTAAFEESKDAAATVESPPQPPPSPSQPTPPAKPWLPLTLTLFALFASLGANVFLGWIAWDFRQRCRVSTLPSGNG